MTWSVISVIIAFLFLGCGFAARRLFFMRVVKPGMMVLKAVPWIFWAIGLLMIVSSAFIGWSFDEVGRSQNFKIGSLIVGIAGVAVSLYSFYFYGWSYVIVEKLGVDVITPFSSRKVLFEDVVAFKSVDGRMLLNEKRLPSTLLSGLFGEPRHVLEKISGFNSISHPEHLP